MPEVEGARFLVSRTVTKRNGLGWERVTFQAEVALPTGEDAGKHLTDLDSIIHNCLEKAESSSRNSNHTPTAISAEKVISGTLQLHLNRFITEFEKTVPAQASFLNNTLIIRVSEGLRLRYDRAPLQSFLIPRVLEPMRSANEITYQLDVADERYLVGITIQLPAGLAEETTLGRVKRLLDPIRWTIQRLPEETT
jgi:hypothetical protein